MKKQKSNIPIVEIETMPFADSQYFDGTYTWRASSLAAQVKKDNLEAFEIPLAGIRLDHLPFDIKDLDDFIYNMKRVENTDLKYPIILDTKGCVADGYHRIAKAILEGKTTIKAYRLKQMPPYDFKEESKH